MNRSFLFCVFLASFGSASEFTAKIDAGINASDPRKAIPLMAAGIQAWEDADGRRPLRNACYNLAVKLMQDGNYKDALTFLDRAVKIDPTFVEARVNRSLVYIFLGGIEAGMRESLDARRLAPGRPEGAMNACLALSLLEDFAGALGYCEESVKLQSTQVGQLNLAIAYAELGRHAEAATAMAAANAGRNDWLSSSDQTAAPVMARAQAAYVIALAGRVDESEKIFAGLASGGVMPVFTYIYRGRAKLRRGALEQGIADLDVVAASDTESVRMQALAIRAKGHARAGHAALAAKDRAEACRLGWTPTCPKAKKRAPREEE